MSYALGPFHLPRLCFPSAGISVVRHLWLETYFFNFTFVYLFVCAHTHAVYTDMVHVWRSEGSFGSLLPLWVLEIELGSPVLAVSTLSLSHLAGPDSLKRCTLPFL